MDNELFELCRRVYEATGWSTEEPGINNYFVYIPILGNKRRDFRDKYKLMTIEQAGADYGKDFDSDTASFTPLYTSDYVLEKLPYRVKDGYRGNVYGVNVKATASGGWKAWYGEIGKDNETAFSSGDTPLKALLRLTLALHDAGELPIVRMNHKESIK